MLRDIFNAYVPTVRPVWGPAIWRGRLFAVDGICVFLGRLGVGGGYFLMAGWSFCKVALSRRSAICPSLISLTPSRPHHTHPPCPARHRGPPLPAAVAVALNALAGTRSSMTCTATATLSCTIFMSHVFFSYTPPRTCEVPSSTAHACMHAVPYLVPHAVPMLIG